MKIKIIHLASLILALNLLAANSIFAARKSFSEQALSLDGMSGKRMLSNTPLVIRLAREGVAFGIVSDRADGMEGKKGLIRAFIVNPWTRFLYRNLRAQFERGVKDLWSQFKKRLPETERRRNRATAGNRANEEFIGSGITFPIPPADVGISAGDHYMYEDQYNETEKRSLDAAERIVLEFLKRGDSYKVAIDRFERLLLVTSVIKIVCIGRDSTPFEDFNFSYVKWVYQFPDPNELERTLLDLRFQRTGA